MTRYLLRSELEARNTTLLLISLGLLLTLLFSNGAWVLYQLLTQRGEVITELHLVKDGKEFVELYLSPEDCFSAGLEVRGPTYWRCELQ